MYWWKQQRFKPDLTVGVFFIAIVVVFYGSIAWTTLMSFTKSTLVPSYEFVGLDQYGRLLSNPRWITSCINMVVYGVGYIGGSLVLGALFAILLDRRVRGEGIFRTIFLHPLALSLIVTGLSWRWLLDPDSGLQAALGRIGLTGIKIDWLVNPQTAIYSLIAASIWHSAGVVMVILLAGLRNVDEDLWKAIRLEGIPLWRAYLQVILPGMAPVIGSCLVLLMSEVIRGYELVVALTKGGPGISTELPAKFAVDYFFARPSLGLASAASISMLILSLLMLTPTLLSQFRSRR